MFEDVSLTSPFEAFASNVDRNHDKTALVYLGTRWSYAELKKLAERFAASLYQIGVRAGDTAVIYLPNNPQAVIAWLALQRLSVIPVVISPIYTSIDLKYMANDTGAKTVLCMDTNFNYVVKVVPETSLEYVIVCDAVGMLPWWKRMLGKAFDRISEGKYELGPQVYSFKSFLKGDPNTLPPLIDDGSERTMLMLYTGGTMGLPKGVPINNINFMQIAVHMREVTAPLIPLGEAVLLQAAPLFHVLGQGSGFGACLCVGGDTMVLAPRVNLDAHFNIIRSLKVNMEYGVPALYRMILEHDRLEQYDLSSLEYCLVGGDAVPKDLLIDWKERFGKPLYQAYGVTEGTGTVVMSPVNEEAPLGSLGKIGTIPSQEILLADPETLEPVSVGSPGEVLLHAEHMVREYWNKPEESREAFVTIKGKLWYKTQDIMQRDEDGWLFFLDRSADMIKHKGYRVAASEVERVLQEHPAVIAACVVGVPDAKVGERIKAFVVIKEDVRGIAGFELINWCKKNLAAYKVPQYIEFRDMLPKSKVGKLLRRELRSEERKMQEKS